MHCCERCGKETDVTMTSPLDGKEICHACYEEESSRHEEQEEETVGVGADPTGIGRLWRDGINYYR
ncbi:MAG TPA: hypothetical protein VJ085_00085 [Candidatus Acidoferrales bacterium]|nr:hypothetical protein [Candidatus Acidoferrales bacterium]